LYTLKNPLNKMSLLTGFRNLCRVGKNANAVFQLKSTTTTTRNLLPHGKGLNLSNLSGFTQRSFFSGSRSMNKAVTQSDQELVEFLREEIKLEKEQQLHPVLPRVKGFSTELTGCEVTLSRDYNGEAIVVKFNINDTVEPDVDEENAPESEEEPKSNLTSKPRFQVDIGRGGQTLTFLCRFTEESPESTEQAEGEAQDADAFEIEEFYIHDGSGDDSPTQYSADADIIDNDLYNLFMNMLDERGISSAFAMELADLSTAHEHKLYIKTLEDIKKFLSS